MVKLFSTERNNPLFPNDPASEALVLEHLRGHELAPRLVDHFPSSAGFCLVYTHLTGRPWETGTARVAQFLHRVHRIPPPGKLRRTADGSNAIRRHGLSILAACPDRMQDRLRDLEPQGHVPPSCLRQLLHGDPVAANFVDSNQRLHLIDWQCPAIGDPCEDLAIFLSPAMQITYRGSALSIGQSAAFLAAYPDQEAVARYRQLAPWYHWRMVAYCFWKDARGDPKAMSAGQAEIKALKAAMSEQH